MAAAAAAGLIPLPAAVLNETGILGIRATSPAALSGPRGGGPQPFVGLLDCGASFSALNWQAAALAGLPPKGDPAYGTHSKRDVGVAVVGVDGRPQVLPLVQVQFSFLGDARRGPGGGYEFESPPAGWQPWAPVLAAVGDLPVFSQLLSRDPGTTFAGPAALVGLDVLSQRRILFGAGDGVRGRGRKLLVAAR